MCYSSEKLIILNILHEVVPTWYSFHSWVDWSNADKVSCSRKQHTAAGVRTVYLCIQSRYSSQPTNMLSNWHNWQNMLSIYIHRQQTILRHKRTCTHTSDQRKEIRMSVASSRPDHLPTLSVAKTSKLSLLVKHHILAIDEASQQQQQPAKRHLQ